MSVSPWGKNSPFIWRPTDKPAHELLSDREYKVMLMISSGKTVTEIAEKMFLSVKTISTYRVRALKKMGMKNNAEFVIIPSNTGCWNKTAGISL